MNYSIKIDESRCVDCGACTRECQRHLPVYRESASAANALECIGCLHCFAVCPQGAISVNFGDADEHTGEWVKTDPMFELFARRRSCRRFQERQIEEDVLQNLTYAAAHIPSGGNSHAHRLTVLTDGQPRHDGGLRGSCNESIASASA